MRFSPAVSMGLAVMLALMLCVTSIARLAPPNAAAQSLQPTFEPMAGVDPADAVFLEEALTLTVNAYASILGFVPQRELTVIADPGEYAPGAETYGVYNGDQITIFTGSLPWHASSDIERINGLVHEYAHYFLDPVPNLNARPIWLAEGLAEYLSWYLLGEIGLVDNSEMLAYYAGHVRFWPPGQELCQLTSGSIAGKAYPLALLGAAVLVESNSIAAVSDYRDAMANGVSHDEAFLTAFGQTEVQFCETATESIAAMTPASSPPSDFFAGPVPASTGAEILLIEVPVSAVVGHQVLIRAKSGVVVECSLSLDVAGVDNDALTRNAVSNGNGEVFWLLTIPQDTNPGAAIFVTECGLDPVESVIWISTKS